MKKTKPEESPRSLQIVSLNHNAVTRAILWEICKASSASTHSSICALRLKARKAAGHIERNCNTILLKGFLNKRNKEDVKALVKLCKYVRF